MEIPNCKEGNRCYALDENPKSFIKDTICPNCSRNKKIHPIIKKLVHYLDLHESLSTFGQTLGRHDLKNEEWTYLHVLKIERDNMRVEARKKDG